MKKIWHNLNVIRCEAIDSDAYGVIKKAAIVVEDGCIAWLGAEQDLPKYQDTCERIDGQGLWMTPGLIDCHTHLVYAGNRANEFEMRLQGKSYQEIAQQGGGILSTVKATRAASAESLYQSAASRLKQLQAEGVTTVEIKSGYGLTFDDEIKMLAVAKQLNQKEDVDVFSTLLAAHTVPPEYTDNRAQYVDLICEQMIPYVAEHNLASAVDAFCETIGFTVAEVERIFVAAKQYGLAIKLHAEQLSNQHGASKACEFGAISADHLEYIDHNGIRAMQRANTIAVLLPGAFYALRETRLPPIQEFRDAGVAMAISTDNNPGTSSVLSLRLMANMACNLFSMTCQEALLGITKNAALALGLHDRGVLSVGKKADFALWDIESPSQLVQEIGGNRCQLVVKNGTIIH